MLVTSRPEDDMRAMTICLAWLAAASLWGQADFPKVDFEKYVLPNGLQVILHVDRKLPVVNWALSGSAPPASSSIVTVRFVTAWPPPASDMSMTF